MKLLTNQVGRWSMNTYVIVCEEMQYSAVIDPGAEPETILAMCEGTQLEKILVTHGHGDHVGALAAIKEASGAPIYVHALDAERFGLPYDAALSGGETLLVGNCSVKVIHVPGHTAGQVCYDLGDGRIVVGDTLFVGGPGKTWAVEEFETTMKTMQEIVFTWPDETRFFPGHGSDGKIGIERPAFEAFLARGWPEGLYGDVAWKED